MSVRSTGKFWSRGLGFFFCLTFLGWIFPLQASPVQIFGYWPKDIAMGGAVVASEPGLGAAYHNPAAGAFSHQQIGVSFSSFTPQLFIERGLPFCGAGPELCSSLYGDSYSDVGAELPASSRGVSLGWVKPIGGAFKNRLAVSAALHIPTGDFLSAEGLDTRMPHFLLYQDLATRALAAFSAAVRPLDWLSVGAGVQVLTDIGADARLYQDPANNAFTQTDIMVEIEPKLGLLAGAMVRPVPGLTLGFGYREEMSLDFNMPADIQAGKLFAMDLFVDGSVLFSPHQFDFGAAYLWDELGLEIVFQGNYALWSRMRNPTPRMDVNIGGEVLDQVGLGEVFDLRELEERSRLGLANTWTLHTGADWKAMEWLKVRGGFQYRPSPVPDQKGSSNLLDNQVFGSSAGLAWLIDNEGPGGLASIEVELSGLFMWLPRRTVTKVPIDPVGSLSYGGYIAGGALSISHKY